MNFSYKNILKSEIILKIFGFLIFLYLHIVYYTSKKSFTYSRKFEKKAYHSKSTLIAFWHNRLALIPFIAPINIKVNILHSGHRDGNIIRNIMHLFNFKTISGSSNKDGAKAIRQILRTVKNNESVAIVPDGPRGPIYKINGAIAKIASKTKTSIIPLSYNCKRKKVFNSWDKFILPLPFNEISFFFGDPIDIKYNASENDIKNVESMLKKSLDKISDQAQIKN
jgi:hypothetical protein